MKKGKILFSFLSLILILGLVSGCTMEPAAPGEELEEEQGEEVEEGQKIGEVSIEEMELDQVAATWLVESSPTFTFSGHDLVQEGDPVETELGKEFTFHFESDYLGYGDLTLEEDSLVEEKVTHTAKVTVNEDKQVVKVVIDGVYDDLNSEMLQ